MARHIGDVMLSSTTRECEALHACFLPIAKKMHSLPSAEIQFGVSQIVCIPFSANLQSTAKIQSSRELYDDSPDRSNEDGMDSQLGRLAGRELRTTKL